MTDTTAPRPPRLLLGGFAGFGDFPVNPSWELAHALGGSTIEMFNVEAVQIPVDWATAWPTLQAAIEATDPAWVLLLGVAGTRTAVCGETRARNFTTPVRDTANALPPANDLIDPAGPPYRICTIPAQLLVERMQERGLPAEVSTDAGSYLCNWTLYHALAYAATQPGLRGVGFIHIPPLAAPGTAGLTFDRMLDGLRFAVDSLVAGQAPMFTEVEAAIVAERHPHAG